MSEHDTNCNCGKDECTCSDDTLTVTLTLDNDQVVECSVLTIYEAGNNEYIALLPMIEDEDDEKHDEIFLYRFSEDESGEPKLDNIDDDDEYELAADAFDEWLDTQEFEELDD
ncbi:MAG: DUF1292 domain-containing protein [Lachnospiraceae bacterium]